MLVALLFVGLGRPSPAVAQPDSVRQEILRAKGLPPDHTPERALWRALALPGWGQYYNRQYFKIPLVYAGLAGLAAGIVYTNDRVVLYRHAALYRQDPGAYPQFEEEYRMIAEQAGGDIDAGTLRDTRDRFKRYRDLSAIGVGLYYALSVLDAYVSAHLLTFDVGEDLSMRVHPSAQGGVTTQLRLRF